jgi:hypothetical protein
MNFFDRLLSSNFFIKLKSWEYWPFGIVQAPLFFYFFWLSFKSRSFLFFSASNPGIAMGGMFGESKSDVQQKIPTDVSPITLLINVPTTRASILDAINGKGLAFPVIFKPDLGERGWMVRRINNDQDIETYLQEIKVNFLIQEFVDLPLEYGVFYVRLPSESNGKVISIVGKEMLYITGDGVQSIRELIFRKERAKLQWEVLHEKFKDRLEEVLPAGERLELVSIGNHCLGTLFINKNELITPQLSASFDQISKKIDGFYFGRFDIRAATEQDLELGRIKIMELNGCGAEPAHIYHPGFSLLEAWRVLFRHWRYIYRIGAENHARGVPYLTLKEGNVFYKKFKTLTAGS